jgi:hypothetical protein
VYSYKVYVTLTGGLMEHLHQTLISFTYARVTGKSYLPEELVKKAQILIESAPENHKSDMDVLFSPEEYEERLQYLWSKVRG